MKGTIYQILNTENNKKYVGSTNNFDIRKGAHINGLKAGNHINRHLQSSVSKYGIEVFKFSVLEEPNVDEMLIREQSYLDSGDFEYNICLKVSEPPVRKNYSPSKETRTKLSKIRLGSHHTKETKLKMSKTRKGVPHSERAKDNMSKMNPRNKTIVQMTIKGDIVETYRSKSYATKVTGIHLDSTLSGRTKTAGGFKWKYIN